MAHTIEIVSLGKDLYSVIEQSVRLLNAAQGEHAEFQFTLPPTRLRPEGRLFMREKYNTKEVFAFLRQYRDNAKGHRPFLIGVVDAPLSSDRLTNLFGSHEAADGLVVVTLHNHARFAPSANAFVCYFLIRYALSFVAPEIKNHEDTRACFFDRKRHKPDLLKSLESGRICDPCMSQLQVRLNPEIAEAVLKMIDSLKSMLAKQKEGQDMSQPEQFDVFLSHNSKDKPTVRQLGEALKARGLRVWLDEWELVPGRPWQEALEEIIQTTKSAAVLVGNDGLGPWEDREMRGCLSEFVDRELPVIPVLLPGAAKKPKLPLFLKQFTWVDLREGLTPDGLDRLQWGITGKKPNPQSAHRS